MRALLALLLLVLPGVALAADFSVQGLTDGQTVSGPITVQAMPDFTPNNVVFSLQRTGGAQVFSNQEYATPYCMNGDNGATCFAYDTKLQPDGAYLLRITATPTTGTGISKTLTLTIANTAPPAPSVTATIDLDEPRFNADGTALTDLTSIRVWCQVAGQTETMCESLPASKLTGGGHLTKAHVFTGLGAGTTVMFRATSMDATGLQSVSTPSVAWKVPGGVPGKAGVSVQKINE